MTYWEADKNHILLLLVIKKKKMDLVGSILRRRATEIGLREYRVGKWKANLSK